MRLTDWSSTPPDSALGSPFEWSLARRYACIRLVPTHFRACMQAREGQTTRQNVKIGDVGYRNKMNTVFRGGCIPVGRLRSIFVLPPS